MVCRHCGKEFPDDAKYCPYCAEPVPPPEMPLEVEYTQRIKKETKGIKGRATAVSVPLGVFATLVAGPVGLAFAGVNYVAMLTYASVRKKKALKPGKKFIINAQFSRDQTSICPKCGSHSIKVYRQGYNYHTGFWGSIFGVRGAGYAGGFDANKARCRCMNCGNDWETDYDYRLVK